MFRNKILSIILGFIILNPIITYAGTFTITNSGELRDDNTSVFTISNLNDAQNMANQLNKNENGLLTINRLKNSLGIKNNVNIFHTLLNTYGKPYFYVNYNNTDKLASIVSNIIQNPTHYAFFINNSGKPILLLAHTFTNISNSFVDNNATFIGYDVQSTSDTNQVIACFGFGKYPTNSSIMLLTAYPSKSLQGCQ